jgi:hypothetical protein
MLMQPLLLLAGATSPALRRVVRLYLAELGQKGRVQIKVILVGPTPKAMMKIDIRN